MQRNIAHCTLPEVIRGKHIRYAGLRLCYLSRKIAITRSTSTH
uniref:Uncharacterized protein n=1 Tax=Arundo donax TaxID=35708 RepID=A0A0A9DCW2_ARUDO